MEYIVIKRFKQKGIGGNFNLPYGTICPLVCDFITSPDGRVICKKYSENGWTYFRPNTEEGRRRQIMLDKLYRYYERGRGNVVEDLDLDKLPADTNSYWKHVLRTMSTDKLMTFYCKRFGKPNFKED